MPCPGDPGPRPEFIPVPDTVRAVMQYTIFGEQIANVFHFTRGSAWALGDMEELALAMRDAWNERLSPLLAGDVELLNITVTDIAAEDSIQYTAVCEDVGTYAGAAFETTGNTFAIKFNTYRTGRSYRGRMYWPLLNANAVNDGRITSGPIADSMVGALTLFFQDVTDATACSHTVVSYMNNCEWRATGVATEVLTYSYSDLNLDSQRRRLPGRGG